jgi:putative Ca2+/H+ antiporter (TMEM165/GDT1 family)
MRGERVIRSRQRRGVAPNIAVDTLTPCVRPRRPPAPPVAGETFGTDPFIGFGPERAPSVRSDREERAPVTGFLAAAALSFAVIFVAELGDKSQLMALTFATRFRALPVLLGITAATAVTHAVSVGVGYLLGATLPTFWISLAAAVAFLVFGLWTLRGDSLSAEEKEKSGATTRSAFVTVGVAFFLAELGDKTMLATVTLATQYPGTGGVTGVWLGSTIGMVVADGLAIILGRVLGRNLPEKAIRIGAAVLFFVFAVWLAVEAFLNA